MKRGQLILIDTGLTLTFPLNPTTLKQSGRMARLSTIDRPRRMSASEWEGTDPFKIEFRLRFDGYPNRPVSDEIAIINRMSGATRTGEAPPKLRLVYAGASNRNWIMESVQWGDEIRRADLTIVRIEVDLTLREWADPEIQTAPAKRAQKSSSSSGAPSGKTHTVVAGDTLWALATKHLGSGTRWQQIADANGIRDPKTLQIGARLRIPG